VMLSLLCRLPHSNCPGTSRAVLNRESYLIFAPLSAKITRQACRVQATSLAVCALDGSLGVKSGCCSTSCSAAMAQVCVVPLMQ
jgi:hypothetical protein